MMFVVHAKPKFGGDIARVHLKANAAFGEYGAEMTAAGRSGTQDSAMRAGTNSLTYANGAVGFLAARGPTRGARALVVRADRSLFRAHALAATRVASEYFLEAIRRNR
jgi:hypothetical protein